MNTQASMVRRDAVAAGAITLAAAALLCAWNPSLRPGFAPARPAPPVITYLPAALTPGAHQEDYNEWNAAHSPALIALSAAMLLPPDKRGKANAVTPPLTAAAHLPRFPESPAVERNDQIPMLTPPRPMTLPAPRRLARQPSAATAAYRVEWSGNAQGRPLDLAPILALSEPDAPWSFSAVLRYNADGRVQHALLDSTDLDPALHAEVARRLYQCRATPGGAPGEGRLTVSGPGRSSYP